MGNRWTFTRGDARQARTALATPVAGPAERARRDSHALTAVDVRVSTDLPTNRSELLLAFGTRLSIGALGVRSPGRLQRTQGGDLADVWLSQPTGRAGVMVAETTIAPIAPCLTDGRAEPARAGRDCVPPAEAGRLEPPDDWRGDARGRNNRKPGAQADRNASARGEAGRWRCARDADGPGRPSTDALQMAVLIGIGGVLITTGGAHALLEVAPRSSRTAWLTARRAARVTAQSSHQRADTPALRVGDVTGTLPPGRSDDDGRRVVPDGRVSVSHTSSRAGRSDGSQEHHHGEPGSSRGSRAWHQPANCTTAERAAAARTVRHSREGLGGWRVRRVPSASRRHADAAGSRDDWRGATRGGCEALDRRAVQPAAPGQRDLCRAARRRRVERDPEQHSRVLRGRPARVPSSSLLQHLEVVAGAGPSGPTWSAPSRRTAAWGWTRTEAAPLTVRSLVRRMMPVIVARSIPVSMAVGWSERTGGDA